MSLIERLSHFDCEEDGLEAIYREIDEMLHAGKFDKVDSILAAVPTTLPILFLLAFISIGYAARDRLIEWKPLVTRVRSHLDQVDPDRATELLQGWE